MTAQTFKVAVVGPSRVGKTTLLTAILSDTNRMLAGTPVSVAMDEATEKRVSVQRKELRRAIEAQEFNPAALEGNQQIVHYYVSLRAAGDEALEIPFHILDYPGGWLDPARRADVPHAQQRWPECERHIENSVMLLVPIDSAVLMEAVTPAHRRAVPDLLGLEDTEAMVRKWARSRNREEHRQEPAVVVLAPMKCEKYFDDNGGTGRDAGRLRATIRQKYANVLEIVREEARDRPVRIVYAPIDTYGCVELMDTEWVDDGSGQLLFRGHYRFRGNPPRISVKAAGSVMQQLCGCLIDGRDAAEAEKLAGYRAGVQALLDRHAQPKGFWGMLGYHLGGEAAENSRDRRYLGGQIDAATRRRIQLTEAVEELAKMPQDQRIEEW